MRPIMIGLCGLRITCIIFIWILLVGCAWLLGFCFVFIISILYSRLYPEINDFILVYLYYWVSTNCEIRLQCILVCLTQWKLRFYRSILEISRVNCLHKNISLLVSFMRAVAFYGFALSHNAFIYMIKWRETNEETEICNAQRHTHNYVDELEPQWNCMNILQISQ